MVLDREKESEYSVLFKKSRNLTRPSWNLEDVICESSYETGEILI